MMKSALGLAAALVIGAFSGLVAPGQTARAQTYPPPVGSLSVEATSTTPGSTSNISATVLDSAGNPVEGAEVIFRIVSQPGSDAHWADGGLETTAITDANGIATAVLSAGSAPGTIIIETVSGEKTSQVTVAVEGEAGLPPTGGAPAEGSDGGLPVWQILSLAVGAAVLAGGLAFLIRRARKA